MDEFPNGTNAIVAVLAYTGAPRGALMVTWCAMGRHAGWAVSPVPAHGCWWLGCWRPASFSSPTQALLLLCLPPLTRNPILAAGYDMEDAMILNKSSVERGFAHAYLYKTEQVDLREERGK